MLEKVVNFIGDEKNAKTNKIILYVILVVVFASDFLVHREHVHYIWDQIPGWGAVYGFVSCVLIIVVSKFFGHQGKLMKKEDYYD